MKRIVGHTILVIFPLLAKAAAVPQLGIQLQHGSPAEAQTRDELLRLIQQYDVSKWIFTQRVLIDQMQIPHSHPVLTLHTRHLNHDDELLSTFVHEEIHWFIEAHSHAEAQAETELRKLFPKLPIGFPDGANDDESNYLHLVVCYDEYQAMKTLLGPEHARKLMDFWASDHYRAIYRRVLDHEEQIGKIVQQHQLEP